jgi:lauroyl/myristoyl acyltransferase
MVSIKKVNATVINPDEVHSRGAVQGWVQTDKKAHQEMARLAVKFPLAIAIIHFLCSRMQRGTNAVIISQDAMAEWLGISKSSVIRSINVLNEQHYIQILKSGKSSIYVVNHQVAWQGKRGYRYATFGAEILITESEQVESVDTLIENGKKLKSIPVPQLGERLHVLNDPIVPPDQNEMDLP